MQRDDKVRRWGLACLISLASVAAFCIGCTGYESHKVGPEDALTFTLAGGAYLSSVALVLTFVGLVIVAIRSKF